MASEDLQQYEDEVKHLLHGFILHFSIFDSLTPLFGV